MNNIEKTDKYLDIVNFFVKAVHGIATGKEFTVQDAKDATDAISAVGQLGMDKLNEKEAAELVNALAQITKSAMDATMSAKLGGWEGKIVVPDNFNDPIDFEENF